MYQAVGRTPPDTERHDRTTTGTLAAPAQVRHVSERFASQTIASADHVELDARTPAAPHPVITRTWFGVREFWVRWACSILSGLAELVPSTSPVSGLDVLASISTRGPPRPL